MDLFVVNDRGQQIDFHGELLGSGSSYADWKSRWFEIDIYRTEAGKYIVAGAGRTLVVHRPTCAVARPADPEPAPDDAVPCDTCQPSLTEPVVVEVDREWAQVSDDPQAIIERLRLRDANGVHYLPRTSADALRAAAGRDDRLRAVLQAPQHVE